MGLTLRNFLYCALLCTTTALWAQIAPISGIVVGMAGTPEANFELEIENSSTGEVFRTTTRDDGSFQFAGLPPGDYVLLTDVGQRDEIRFSATAGRPPVRVRILSTVGGGTTPDVSTEVESISRFAEHIAEIFPQGEVDESVQADFTNPSGDLHGGYNLTLLTEAIRPPLEFSPFVGIGVGGRDEQSNDFTVGGVDNNNRAIPGPLLYLPDAATLEVTIQQNPTAPTASHVSGGHINAITTGGSNQVHGSAYWYLQNRQLNARDPRLDVYELEDNPRFDQNRYGGAVTAPIIKNKLFVTANLEFIPFGFTAYPNGRTLAPTPLSIQALRNNPRISQQNLDLLAENVNVIRGFGDPIIVDGVAVSTGLVDTAIDGYRNTWAGVGGLDFVAPHRQQPARLELQPWNVRLRRQPGRIAALHFDPRVGSESRRALSLYGREVQYLPDIRQLYMDLGPARAQLRRRRPENDQQPTGIPAVQRRIHLFVAGPLPARPDARRHVATRLRRSHAQRQSVDTQRLGAGQDASGLEAQPGARLGLPVGGATRVCTPTGAQFRA
jgi:hypothetical protein